MKHNDAKTKSKQNKNQSVHAKSTPRESITIGAYLRVWYNVAAVIFVFLLGIMLLLPIWLLHQSDAFYRSFRFGSVGFAFLISIVSSLLIAWGITVRRRSRGNLAHEKSGVISYLLRVFFLTAAVSLLFFALLSFFYLDQASVTYENPEQQITNLYFIGISLKLYLAVLVFSLIFSLGSLVFRAPLLHPMAKLLLHFLCSAGGAAVVELTICKSFTSDAVWLGASVTYLVLYTIFGAIYLLAQRLRQKQQAQETYHSLYRTKE